MVLLLLLLLVPTAQAATVHADATRLSDTTLQVRLDVTVKHGTSLYMEGCADIQGGLSCGGGKAKRVKVRHGHTSKTVRLSNMVQHYTPPPLGTTAAWDAWKYMPGKTDTAFLWFAGKAGLTEVHPTASAAETLTEGNP